MSIPGAQALQPHHPRRIGPYQVLGVLGAGGMGQVYLAADGNGLVAVKVVHPGLTSDARFRVRFAREVEAGRRVHGPWTAAVVDADPQARLPWLATEYIPGVPLNRAVTTTGPLPPGVVAALAAHLARALVDIHAAGLVHRDIKPGNVLLGHTHALLIDFGISHAQDDTRMTTTGYVIGTPAFLSPEQAEGTEPTTASDVFSLGGVLVWAATGRGPFGDGNPVALLRRIRTADPELGALAEPVRELAARCLRRDPAARPTAAQVVERLDHLLGPVPGRPGWLPPDVTALLPDPTRLPAPVAPAPSTTPQRTPEPTPQPTARRMSRRGLLAGLGAVAVAGGGLVTAGLLTARAGAQVRWTYPTNGPVARVTTGDTPDTSGIVYADAGGMVHAIDVGTGQARWTHALHAEARGHATVDGTVVASPSSGLHALDAATGTLRWEAREARLLAAGQGIVVSHTSGMDGREHITAVDAATGAARWNLSVGAAFDGSRSGLGRDTPAAVADGRLHVAMESLRTFDAATGALLWEQPLPPANALTVDGAIVCCVVPGRPDYILAFDAATGQERWRRASNDSATSYGPITAHDGTLYFMIGRTVAAWDIATGTPRWERGLPNSFSEMDTAPVVQGDALYVGGQNYRGAGEFRSSLFRYTPSSGEHRWSVDPDPDPGSQASFTIAGGALVVGTNELRAESGAVMGIW
jgi:eukaryotic-like serine/threonine-protein kinase